MITITRSIIISHPKEKVFSFVSDYKNDPGWRSGVLEMKQKPENKTDLGTETFETIKLMGRKLIVKAKIVEYRPDERVGFRTVSAPMNINGYREVEAHENTSTKFTYSLSAELTGIYKLFSSYVTKMYTDRIEIDLIKLKFLLENHA